MYLRTNIGDKKGSIGNDKFIYRVMFVYSLKIYTNFNRQYKKLSLGLGLISDVK
jgi:hypothetical protein